MAVTPNYGFRYPVKGDTRGTALDIQNLAMDVDSRLAAEAASPTRPWWSFVRWTSGSLGTAVDVAVIAWDLQESNFTLATPVQNGAVIVPRDGMYLLNGDVEFLATWAGNPQCSVGMKTTSAPIREIMLSRNENNSAGGQRRSYSPSGMMRALAGQEIYLFMNQPGGSGTVNHSAGDGSPGGRHASRFSGLWVGP